MKKKLDNVTKIQFPTIETWGHFYREWNEDLVESLGRQHSLVDRQDAVASAFFKLMQRKGKEDYDHVPRTESEWFGCIRWQAKAALSHDYESRATREKYHQAAMCDRLVNTPGKFCCNIDFQVMSNALYETLYEVCRDAGVKAANVEAYVRWYLNGESSESVAQDLGTTAQNLYVIRFRVEKLLGENGKAKFAETRAKMFLEAA